MNDLHETYTPETSDRRHAFDARDCFVTDAERKRFRSRVSGTVIVHVSDVDKNDRPTRICVDFPGQSSGKRPDDPLTINGIGVSGFSWVDRLDQDKAENPHGNPGYRGFHGPTAIERFEYRELHGTDYPDSDGWVFNHLNANRIGSWAHDDATDSARAACYAIVRGIVSRIVNPQIEADRQRAAMMIGTACVDLFKAERKAIVAEVEKETARLGALMLRARKNEWKRGAETIGKAITTLGPIVRFLDRKDR